MRQSKSSNAYAVQNFRPTPIRPTEGKNRYIEACVASGGCLALDSRLGDRIVRVHDHAEPWSVPRDPATAVQLRASSTGGKDSNGDASHDSSDGKDVGSLSVLSPNRVGAKGSRLSL